MRPLAAILAAAALCWAAWSEQPHVAGPALVLDGGRTGESTDASGRTTYDADFAAWVAAVKSTDALDGGAL